MTKDLMNWATAFLVKHERTVTLTACTETSMRATGQMKDLANWSSTVRFDGLCYSSSAPKMQYSIPGMDFLQDHKTTRHLMSYLR